MVAWVGHRSNPSLSTRQDKVTHTVGKWVELGGTLGTMVARFLAMALQLAILDNAGKGTAWGLLYVFLVALLQSGQEQR